MFCSPGFWLRCASRCFLRKNPLVFSWEGIGRSSSQSERLQFRYQCLVSFHSRAFSRRPPSHLHHSITPNVTPQLLRRRFVSHFRSRSTPSLPFHLSSFFKLVRHQTSDYFANFGALRDEFLFGIVPDLQRNLPRIIPFVCAFTLVVEYCFDTKMCDGPSMEPTILDGGHTCVLIEKWSHRLFALRSNLDRTSCKVHGKNCSDDCENAAIENVNPHDEASTWSKLLRGIWKQHFASGLQRGDVVILHHPSREGTICKRIVGMPGDIIEQSDGIVESDSSRGDRVNILPGHIWVEGDNTPLSLDSRVYGQVPASLVIGKVVFRIWPLREYVSIGKDANGIERWGRISARIERSQ